MVYTFFPKLEHSYLLDEDRVGILKFIGETKFAPGTWYGFALIDSVGKHDGEVKGKRYFKTSNHPPRGVFVRRAKIVSEVVEESSRRGTTKRNLVAGEIPQEEQSALKEWKPAKYEAVTKVKKEPRIDRQDSQFYLAENGKMRKFGPRHIEKVEGWEPASYGTLDTSDSDADSIEQKQQVYAQHCHTEAGQKKKLGSKELRRSSTEWKPAKFSTPDTGKFLQRMRTLANVYGIEKREPVDAEHYTTECGKKKKLGPREIGRVTNWEPAKYDVPNTGEFLAKRRYLVPGSKLSEEITPRKQVDTQYFITESGQKRKLGPREIGQVEGWEPAKYELPSTGEFLARRKRSFIRLPHLESKNITRTKSGSQDYVTETDNKTKSVPEESFTTERCKEEHSIPDREKAMEIKPEIVSEQLNGKVERYDPTDAQHVITGNGNNKIPPIGSGGVVFEESAENEVAYSQNILTEQLSRNLKIMTVEENAPGRVCDAEQQPSCLHAKDDVPLQVLCDSEEVQYDNQSASDSVFVEHQQESVNVSPSSEEETTDELRF